VTSEPLVTRIEADNKRGPVVWDRSLRCYPQALRRSPRVGQSCRLRLAQKLSAAGEVFFNSIDDSIDQGGGKRWGMAQNSTPRPLISPPTDDCSFPL
jgi:hypothetical protein